MTPLPHPNLVCSQADLLLMSRELCAQSIVAVDTESNSMHAYRERVCLIQFSIPGQDYIVDPLALEDLVSLRPLFADAGIEKVFHAAEYDLICLWRDFGWEVRNIFDTMVAARALGWKHIGLAAILKEKFSISVSKRYQRADWGKRPLSDAQLDYAQVDTRYLLQLRERQEAELRGLGRLMEVREEFERIARASRRISSELSVDQQGADRFWRISGARKLSGRECAVLQELYQYRDGVAKRKNKPPFRIMGDATLVALAQRCPRGKDSLQGIIGMTDAQIRRYGKGILQAVNIGLQAVPPKPPQVKRSDRRVSARYEALREWRKYRAQQRGITSDLVLAREVMWALARAAPVNMADLESVEDLGPWRRAKYGEEILSLLLAAGSDY